MIGQTISHFEVLEKLGEGGMGVVYKARDLRLKRFVSLKFVSGRVGPRERDALRHEAQLAASLNHPNVGTVYELEEADGETFLVMEYLPGTTLRELLQKSGQLPLNTTFDLAVQITSGLRAAHEAGLLHGDVKSDNMIVTPDGRVRIVDFGLARILGSTRPLSPEWTPGTTAYMSPEQLRGEPLDQRSDLWSLGVVLFELFTGRLPFTGKYEQAISYAVVHEKSPIPSRYRPDLPGELDTILARALQKKPGARYATASDLLEDLERVRTSTGTQPRASRTRALRRPLIAIISVLAVIAAAVVLFRETVFRDNAGPEQPASVAVLPFRVLGPEGNQSYLGDGITEAIITDLSVHPDLIVIARRSVMPYRNQTRTLSEIARDLDVRYVVDGSLQHSGGRVRVTVQLVDAGTGRQVWADRFDCDTTDLLRLQDDIAARVTSELPVAPVPAAQRARRLMTSNPAAYATYLRAVFYGSQVDRTFSGATESMDDAVIRLLEDAVNLDPRFGVARATLASSYITKVFNRDPSARWLEKAACQIDTAFSIDPDLPEAHLAKGYLLWTRAYGFRHTEAIASVRRALTLKPGLADAHDLLGTIETHVGLLDEAFGEFQTTLRLDPRSVSARNRIPGVLLYRRQYEEVLRAFARHPQFGYDMQWMPALALMHLHRSEEAAALLDSSLRNSPDSEDLLAAAAVLSASRGDREATQRHTERAISLGGEKSHFHHAQFNIACAYALLGDRPQALHWLQKTARNGMPCYPLFRDHEFLTSVRGDPEFVTLLAETKAVMDACKQPREDTERPAQEAPSTHGANEH